MLQAIAVITKQKIKENLSIFYGLLSNVHNIRGIFTTPSTSMMKPFVKLVFQQQIFDNTEHNTSNFAVFLTTPKFLTTPNTTLQISLYKIVINAKFILSVYFLMWTKFFHIWTFTNQIISLLMKVLHSVSRF